MKRIIQLTVILVLIYFLYTRGLPWIQQRIEQGPTTLSETARTNDVTDCLGRARKTSEYAASRISRFSGPSADLEDWKSVHSTLSSRILDAQDACNCEVGSCRKASEALYELNGLVSEIDSSLRLGKNPPLHAATTMNRVQDLIYEAQVLAREGE